MSENSQNGDPVGSPSNNPVDDEVKTNVNGSTNNTQDDQDFVKYDTYKKTVDESKRKSERLKSQSQELEELRLYKQKIEEDELARKGEYEKLLQTRDERINSLQSELDKHERNRIESQKINAFLEELGGDVKKDEYLSFVDWESIQRNPETGEIDKLTLEKAVSSFTENYDDLYIKKNQKKLPNVGHLGGKPNLRRRLKDLTDAELKQVYLKQRF